MSSNGQRSCPCDLYRLLEHRHPSLRSPDAGIQEPFSLPLLRPKTFADIAALAGPNMWRPGTYSRPHSATFPAVDAVAVDPATGNVLLLQATILTSHGISTKLVKLLEVTQLRAGSKLIFTFVVPPTVFDDWEVYQNLDHGRSKVNLLSAASQKVQHMVRDMEQRVLKLEF